MRAKVRSTFVANVTFWSDDTTQDSDVLRWCWNSTDGRCARKMEMGTTFPIGVGLGGLEWLVEWLCHRVAPCEAVVSPGCYGLGKGG